MSFNIDKYLLIYADCIPVKGYNQSTLCDFNRNRITAFDSSFFHLFDDFKNKTLDNIFEEFEPDSRENLNMFISFLVTNDFGQVQNDISSFPEIKTNFESYGIIDNAIVDIDQIKHRFDKIIFELNKLQCKYLQLRFFSTIYSLDEISAIIKIIEDTSIEGIEIILKSDLQYIENDYVTFFESHFLISSLYVFSHSKKQDIITTFGYEGKVKDEFIQSTVFFTTDDVMSEKQCGIIDKSYFCVNNITDYNHNKIFNSCLNKKIAIDKNGDIKNCPSIIYSYGNISNASLSQVISPEFKELWTVTKDSVEVCKDCEYRYVCTDCRAYLKEPQNMRSKPLKCGYSPYTNEWNDWKNDINDNVLKNYEML